MHLGQLKLVKGVVPGRSVLDFMGPQELAANLFRITQTEAKIQNEDIRGQRLLERAAFDVGRTVRGTMVALSGKAPESLPAVEDIRTVKGNLKRTRKEFGKLDKPRRKALPPPSRTS